MSWSTSTPKAPKAQVASKLGELSFPGVLEPAALDQVDAAKRAALEILKTIPGPLIVVSLSGHANGVGWQAKEGWANDAITVSVTQHLE